MGNFHHFHLSQFWWLQWELLLLFWAYKLHKSLRLRIVYKHMTTGVTASKAIHLLEHISDPSLIPTVFPRRPMNIDKLLFEGVFHHTSKVKWFRDLLSYVVFVQNKALYHTNNFTRIHRLFKKNSKINLFIFIIVILECESSPVEQTLTLILSRNL